MKTSVLQIRKERISYGLSTLCPWKYSHQAQTSCHFMTHMHCCAIYQEIKTESLMQSYDHLPNQSFCPSSLPHWTSYKFIKLNGKIRIYSMNFLMEV